MSDAQEMNLIYRNMLNGVPVENLMVVFKKSEKEVWSIFNTVTQHVMNFVWKHKRPHIPCETLALARGNRREIFTILNNIKLDSSPILRIRSEKFDSKHNPLV